MIVCSGCGSAIKDDLQFCTECGAQNPAMRAGEATLPLGTPPAQIPNRGRIDFQQPSSQAAVTNTGFSSQERIGVATPQSIPTLQHVPATSNRTPLIIVCALVSGVLLLVLGGVASRLWFSDNKPAETTSGTAQTAASPNDISAAPEPTAPQSQRDIQTQSQTPPRSAAPTFDGDSLRREVTDTLNSWAAATRSHDLDGHVSFYADTLDFYFLRTKVSRNYVRASLAPAYARYNTLDVQLSNISVDIDQSGMVATATFDKTYHFEGDKILEGSVQELLTLTRINGRWLITGARDLKVYYSNK